MRIGEHHALGSQFVHVRRPGLRVALKGARPVIQIIDRDEEDIGSVGLSLNRIGRREQSEDQRG